MKPLKHHGTIGIEGLWERSQMNPNMPRDASLSDCRGKYVQREWNATKKKTQYTVPFILMSVSCANYFFHFILLFSYILFLLAFNLFWILTDFKWIKKFFSSKWLIVRKKKWLPWPYTYLICLFYFFHFLWTYISFNLFYQIYHII